MMRIFDTHAHYDDDAFDKDREELLENEFGEGRLVTNITNIGCDIQTSRASVKFAKKYDYMYASVGVIPHHVGDMTDEDIERAKNFSNLVWLENLNLR